MDARITKDRLSNLLAYDWLKIVVAIVAAVCALSVFFTTVRTRPTNAQTFTVFAQTDLSAGEDSVSLAARLEEKNVFSYDILTVGAESFSSSSSYGSAIFTARRSAGEGNVMFVSDNPEYGEDGAVTKESELMKLVAGENAGLALDAEKFFSDCRQYLVRFFGEDLSRPLDEKEAESCFRARNGKDKRYKNEAAVLKGIEQEKDRLEKLREDYAFVSECFDRGLYTFTKAPDQNGAEYACSVYVGNLKGLKRLYYYTEDRNGTSVRTTDTVNLILLNNRDEANDLRYESVSFLRYLAETYENTPA